MFSDGVIGSKTKAALSRGEESYINTSKSSERSNNSSQSSTETITYGLDLRNYDPSKQCINGYVDSNNVWVADPCFYPVFVYRFGNTAQVNSQNELDAYLGDRWSLEKRKNLRNYWQGRYSKLHRWNKFTS